MYLVMDDQKIYHIIIEINIGFRVDSVIDFSYHNLYEELCMFREIDWHHMCVTNRSLIFNGKIYSLHTELQHHFILPRKYNG